ncbi:ty3-gypsy retrotransposon protein, partial [Tanacetum coccineum]
MDPQKVTAVKDWPVPTSLSQLQAFLRLTEYYRRFIKLYSTIAHPLTNLLRKDNFHWSIEAESAFDALKQALITAPALRLPDFKKLFIIETDASGYGIGAILSQDGHPISFFSNRAITSDTRTRAFLPKLLGYNFKIEYKASHSNLAADGLSRRLHMAVSSSHSSILSDIRDSLTDSPYVSSLLHQ